MERFISKAKKSLSLIYPTQEAESIIFHLIGYVCEYSRTQILMNKNRELSNENRIRLELMLSKLEEGEPLQYIIGETTFYNLNFKVKKGVLIPRPETEELVDIIIRENQNPNLNVLDIGTGSGCIAISLAKNMINSNVEAWDISNDALIIAAENAELNNVEIAFKHVDILNYNHDNIRPQYNIIVSNPPYICDQESISMHKNVLDHEPHLALFVPDNDPLLFYRKIAEFGKTTLSNGGKIYFEINERFGIETTNLLDQLGYCKTRIINDIHNKNRIVTGENSI